MATPADEVSRHLLAQTIAMNAAQLSLFADTLHQLRDTAEDPAGTCTLNSEQAQALVWGLNVLRGDGG